jgi:methyl halide transferase
VPLRLLTGTAGARRVLSQLMEREPAFRGHVFVPGAGSCYDAIHMSQIAESVTALDISPTAVERATTIARRDAVGSASLTANKLRILEGDFFTHRPTKAYDLVWDYTFLCALPLSMREAWAHKMFSLVAPGGRLVTMIYPVGTFSGGPPFAMTPEGVHNLLSKAGFQPEVLEPVPEADSFPKRRGREWLGVWSHAVNMYPAVHCCLGESPRE